MFRALLSHPQDALHSGTWYIACVLCQLAAPGLKFVPYISSWEPWHFAKVPDGPQPYTPNILWLQEV
jgi:hypothetical protein